MNDYLEEKSRPHLPAEVAKSLCDQVNLALLPRYTPIPFPYVLYNVHIQPLAGTKICVNKKN